MPKSPCVHGQEGPAANDLHRACTFCTHRATEVDLTKMACIALARFTPTRCCCPITHADLAEDWARCEPSGSNKKGRNSGKVASKAKPRMLRGMCQTTLEPAPVEQLHFGHATCFVSKTYAKSRWGDLNPQPPLYESGALPLSYIGIKHCISSACVSFLFLPS
jgi:hypothetical protein